MVFVAVAAYRNFNDFRSGRRSVFVNKRLVRPSNAATQPYDPNGPSTDYATTITRDYRTPAIPRHIHRTAKRIRRASYCTSVPYTALVCSVVPIRLSPPHPTISKNPVENRFSYFGTYRRRPANQRDGAGGGRTPRTDCKYTSFRPSSLFSRFSFLISNNLYRNKNRIM